MLDGLLSGNFRHWGVPQLQQYQKTFGNVFYIGVEWEFPLQEGREKVNSWGGVESGNTYLNYKIPDGTLCSGKQLDSYRGFRETSCGNAYETTYLYVTGTFHGSPLKDAKVFRQQIVDTHRIIGEYGWSTTGGIHININAVVPHTGQKCDYETNTRRHEFKFMSPYLMWYDLVLQMYLAIRFYRVITERACTKSKTWSKKSKILSTQRDKKFAQIYGEISMIQELSDKYSQLFALDYNDLWVNRWQDHI